MTAPTVGTACLFYPGDDREASPSGQPVAATVLAVRANGLVDIGLSGSPTPMQRFALPFLQPDDDPPQLGSYVMSAA